MIHNSCYGKVPRPELTSDHSAFAHRDAFAVVHVHIFLLSRIHESFQESLKWRFRYYFPIEYTRISRYLYMDCFAVLLKPSSAKIETLHAFYVGFIPRTDSSNPSVSTCKQVLSLGMVYLESAPKIWHPSSKGASLFCS